MANDDDAPQPPPRKSRLSKIDKKPPISAPFNFRHVCHVGSDFRSEDVKRAISSKSLLEEIDSLPEAPPPPSQNDGYEKVTPRHSQRSTELVPDPPIRSESLEKVTPRYSEQSTKLKRALAKPDDGNGKAPEKSSQPKADSKRTLVKPEDGNGKAPERSSHSEADSKFTLATPDDGNSKAPERPSQPKVDSKPDDGIGKAPERSSQPEVDSVSQRPQQSLRAKSLNLDDAMPKVDVSWYQNVNSAKGTSETPTESCESIEWKDTSEMSVRTTKKTKPAPPPPTSDSPTNSETNDVSNNEGNVMWRPTIPKNPSKPPESIHLIKTPEKIQQPSISSSMVLERPDDLGNMSSRLSDTIPVPSSVSSGASPAVAPHSDSSQAQHTRHWISELPPEEQKRISGIWQEATGETEIPDDSIAVRKAIAMFEARLQKRAPPPRPPPPRRHAPPPPIKVKVDQDQGRTSSTDTTAKNGPDATSQNSSSMPDSKNDKVIRGQDAGSHSAASPSEQVHDRLPTPLPTSSQQFPIPKPRMKLLGKLEEDPEIAVTDASHTSNIVLPEYFVEECLLSLSLKSPKGVEHASCEELRRVATTEKAEATYVSRQTTKITVENVRLETSKASNETSQADKKGNDTEENVVITRF
ncbi:unnamed protein product [Haemonchus placei]|uniref:CRIB domain-containing protein n=1 Tax=Haemonchus placei TaxID=6290 RepID=A0A158QMD2_HAEPC|nr:unnamed protein product [Haemonchus placei]